MCFHNSLFANNFCIHLPGLLAGTDIVLKIAEQHAALYVRLLFYNC